MPFINTKVNVEISEEKEKELKEKLGKAIEIIHGNSEQWLMLGFEDNARLYFRGNNASKIAFVEVKVFGGENKNAFNIMTGKICEIFNEVLGIDPDKVYVKYEAVANWGWNGSNF